MAKVNGVVAFAGGLSIVLTGAVTMYREATFITPSAGTYYSGVAALALGCVICAMGGWMFGRTDSVHDDKAQIAG